MTNWQVIYSIEQQVPQLTKEQQVEQREVLGKEFKIYGTIENPLFLAKDVANWIEHSRASEMLKGIDEDEKLMQTILASGQRREMWFLTEDVANWIEHNQVSMMLQSIDEDEKVKVNIVYYLFDLMWLLSTLAFYLYHLYLYFYNCHNSIQILLIHLS